MRGLNLNGVALWATMAIWLGGCEKNEPVPVPKDEGSATARIDGGPAQPRSSPSSPAPVAAENRDLPAAHSPIGQMQAAGAGDAGKPLLYEVGKEWKSEPVKRPMRVAQYSIPGGAGEGELAVFHGPGVGGATDMNIARWRGMFTREGKPVGDDGAKVQVSWINGLKVTALDVAGDYSDPMRMQGASVAWKGETRMLAAVVETTEGPWFFKMVGPKATIDGQQGAWEKMVLSMKR